MAVLRACQKIANRLKPVRLGLKTKLGREPTFQETTYQAYFDKIDLSAHGFYSTPEVGYDFASGIGKPFGYFTTAVGCSEVEVDLLTGDMHVIRTDILMDLGKSLNPAIDIGQIHGAFMQGYGLL